MPLVSLSGDSHHFLWFLKSLGQLAPSQLTRHLRTYIHSLLSSQCEAVPSEEQLLPLGTTCRGKPGVFLGDRR